MLHSWANRATRELACWLAQDVMGQDLAQQLLGPPTQQDTPVTNLAIKLRGGPAQLAQLSMIEI